MEKKARKEQPEKNSMKHTTGKLLSGKEAAEFLGIKVATLYAYVSRGLIESIDAEGSRERSYQLDDLIRLRNCQRGLKRPSDAASGDWPGPVIKSAITEIRDDGHFYRGERATKLALRDTPFEDVAELLWGEEHQQARLNQQTWQSQLALIHKEPLKLLIPEDADILQILKVVAANAEILSAQSTRLEAPDALQQSRQLILRLASAVGLPHRHGRTSKNVQCPVATVLSSSLTGKASSEQVLGVNRALVLCADHELNASTLSARVAASCDASLHSCVLSALGTFSGTLHGGSGLMLEQLVLSTLNADNVSKHLRSYMEHNTIITGFGSTLYPQVDPRAQVLLKTATQISSSKKLQRLMDIITFIKDKAGQEPNLDAGLLALSFALSLPHGASSAMFAVGRTAGWIAHAREQRLYGNMIRPRARYIGIEPQF